MRLLLLLLLILFGCDLNALKPADSAKNVLQSEYAMSFERVMPETTEDLWRAENKEVVCYVAHTIRGVSISCIKKD